MTAFIRNKLDWLFLDELDYMGEDDYSTVAMIAGERPDIGMTCSSTPTGKRGIFYEMCMNPDMGFTEHYHPCSDNPFWNEVMEDEFRQSLTKSQYEHEILAEFGTEDMGVFHKDAIDFAKTREDYAYLPLTLSQERDVRNQNKMPRMLLYDRHHKAPPNVFRCMGVIAQCLLIA